MRCSRQGKGDGVEFEFKSSNYIGHKHHRDDLHNAKCKMIICWKDDLDDKDLERYGLMQDILSMEKFLIEGKAELRSR